MTTGHAAEKRGIWRRRLRPAAPLFFRAGSAGLLVSFLGLSGGSAHHDPPAGRPLPQGALAAEHGQGTPAPPRRSSVRQLVDVLDRAAPSPRRIRIPAIGVSARVVPLGLDAGGTMQTPRNYGDTGWFKPGREPGELGPAVVTGHVDSKSGPAVFYRLRELRRGDLIRIDRADGSVVRFRVEGLERWPKAEFPTKRVFSRTRVAALRLVTCSGNFDASTGHYVDNTIVYAARVPVWRTIPSPAG